MGKIKVRCGKCGNKMLAPESASGRKVKCPKCETVFVIDSSTIVAVSAKPAAKKSDSPAAAKFTQDASVPSQSSQKPVATPAAAKSVPEAKAEPYANLKDLKPLLPTSTIGLGLFGAIVVLVIYWGTFLLVIGGTGWFAISNLEMLTGGDILKIPLYVAGVAAGLMLALVIAKPVLVSRKRKVTRSINLSSEPELATIIKRVAAALDAPLPVLVESDYEFELNVRPLGSWFDFSRENIGLTVGVPVLTCYNVEQFAILLTSKLALFSRPLFSKVWLFVIRIYDWVEKVSWRNDRWDDNVNEAAASGKYGSIFIPFAAIWNLVVLVVNRLPFKVLYQIMSLISRVPIQNQQLNADQAAYNLVGVGPFSEFLHETQNLIFAHDSATNDFIESVQSKYQVNNKFEGITLKRKYINEYQLVDIKELLEAGKTWSFGAVSSDAKRIEMAQENGVEVQQPLGDQRPMIKIVKSYYHLAAQGTTDMANQLKIIVGTVQPKSQGSRKKRADAINRYIKSAVRDGIKSQN